MGPDKERRHEKCEHDKAPHSKALIGELPNPVAKFGNFFFFGHRAALFATQTFNVRHTIHVIASFGKERFSVVPQFPE